MAYTVAFTYQCHKNSSTHTHIYSQIAIRILTATGAAASCTDFIAICGRSNCWPTNVTADISHNLFHSFGVRRERENETIYAFQNRVHSNYEPNSAPNDTINFSFILGLFCCRYCGCCCLRYNVSPICNECEILCASVWNLGHRQL